MLQMSSEEFFDAVAALFRMDRKPHACLNPACETIVYTRNQLAYCEPCGQAARRETNANYQRAS
jgi:hypothetical protein